MLITPRVSEKSYKLSADGQIYVFDVPLDANKAEIIAEIEKQYDGVKVRDARMLVSKGKAKSASRGKRARPIRVTRKDTKKAYVTISEGKIEIAAFQEVDNQAKEVAAKAETTTKSTNDGKNSKGETVVKRRTGRRGDK